MASTRSVRPTDLVALVSLDGRVFPNEARTWDRLGRKPEGPRLLDSALEPWLAFASRRHTWISIQGLTIQGLLSARRRGNRTVWEVDCLIVATDEERAILDLFEQLTTGAIRSGAHRIFLRVDAESNVLPLARKAGFVPYAKEMLLRLDGQVPPAELPHDIAVRPRTDVDAFALYRLYNATVPEAIRRVEAPTFQYWEAADEKRIAGRMRSDLIVERNGGIVAHLQIGCESDIGRISLTLHPDAEQARQALIWLAVSKTGEQRPVFCLVPAYATGLATHLDGCGFVLEAEFIAFVKHMTVPIVEHRRLRVPLTVPKPLATS